jgi:putative membrane protein
MKSNDTFLNTVFVMHVSSLSVNCILFTTCFNIIRSDAQCYSKGRAIDKFIVPLTIVTVNAIIWTILINTRFKNSVDVDEEPWASVYNVVFTTALAFLLVFRLNRVAARWWSTRTMWGLIIANSRTLVGAILEHCAHEPELRDLAISWIAAYSIAVKEHMRNNTRNFEFEEIVGYLSPEQVKCIASSKHPCLYAATEIRHLLKRIFDVSADTPAALGIAYASEMRLMEKSLDALNDMMGGLERVQVTPLPITFVSHLRTIIMFYLLSLPYLYGNTWGWGTIPSVLLTSYALLGIDGAASECEAPFEKRPNHLDMDGFCLTMQRNIEQLISHNHELRHRQYPC